MILVPFPGVVLIDSLPPSFSILSDKAKYAPWGLFGGGAARPAKYVLNPDTSARELPSKITLQLQPGDVVSVQTPGGGGCAPVWQRSPALVAADVAAGKISVARARQVYGVVVHPDTYTVDETATAAERARFVPSPATVSAEGVFALGATVSAQGRKALPSGRGF